MRTKTLKKIPCYIKPWKGWELILQGYEIRMEHFCGYVVFDNVNMAYRDENSILDSF